MWKRTLRAAPVTGIFVVLVVVLVILATAARARAQAATLTSADFTLGLARVDSSSGKLETLTAGERAAFFSAARCACPTSYGVTLALTSAGAAKLSSSDTLEATVMIGSDCDNVEAAACASFGAGLTLGAGDTSSSETLSTAAVFEALAPGKACGELPASSSRLWAIVRLNGTRLASQPALVISLGGAAPKPPTALATQPADGGLLVSWSAPAGATTLRGYQVLCSPGLAAPPAAAFDDCAAAAPAGDGGIFDALDPALICSDLIAAGSTSTRVRGLANGTAYQLAVVSIGADGTASAPSAIAAGTPAPTLGFDDLYEEAGGTGMAGCAVGGAGARASGRAPGLGAAAMVGLAMLVPLAKRRRRRWALPLGLVLLAPAAAARAEAPPLDLYGGAPAAPIASPRNWNLELRFGPYYPDVDSELADQGSAARPFEQVFSSKKRLMMGLELDRQLSHRGGTWAVGVGVGRYEASAAALAADHVTRTGDETRLRIIPLSLLAVYRADLLRTRLGSPLVPYAKLGLACALWSVTETAKSGSTSGQTLGWSAAAGASLDLSFLDPEAMRTMDGEVGINQLALFFEVSRSALDGFGSSSVLRVGDTTWLAGVMLEL